VKKAQSLLLTVLLFAACKKAPKPETHYPQDYGLSHNTTNDSVVAWGSIFYGKSSLILDGVPTLMKLNGVPADSFSEKDMNYLWFGKGLKDAVFTLETHGRTLTNVIKASEFKTYSFMNLPDTVSQTGWKTMQWQGPSAKGDRGFFIDIYFSDGSNKHFIIPRDTTAFSFSADLLKTKPPGRTKCVLGWTGPEKPLQMPDVTNHDGGMYVSSLTEKYVWLAP
jgi:hypothetical protein